MRLSDFKRVLAAFADGQNDIDVSKSKIIVQVRDELMEATLSQREGTLLVSEHDTTYSAEQWIINRVARLQLLADRLLSYVPRQAAFVAPSGSVAERFNVDASGNDRECGDALEGLKGMVENRLIGSTSVIYLTSDAGEGKTTLIQALARKQAEAYKAKASDWLLVPIELGGRGFQRFGDAVVATLLNKYRFPMLYFEGFLELVKLGVVVPAFDGFEEVFIESSSGEAVTALGGLVNSLESSGTCVISARNAYFEYQSYLTQSQLFDAMNGASAEFGRVQLHRWNAAQFDEYARLRGVKLPDQLRRAIAGRLGDDHPLLTRAVLASKVVDLCGDRTEVNAIINDLGSAPDDYFFKFVQALVEREASLKWVDRSGEPARPILSLDEHTRLLASVAGEMWLSSTEVLRSDVLDVVADFFSELLGRGPVVSRQVRERLKQHSMLVSVDGKGGAFAFDHEDFRKYYLGEHLGALLGLRRASELRHFLSVSAIPYQTAEAAVRALLRNAGDAPAAANLLVDIAAREPKSSFVNENAGLLALLLVERTKVLENRLAGFVFPPNSLSGRTLEGVTFADCHFQPTELTASTLRRVRFLGCRFERIEFDDSVVLEDTQIEESEVASVVLLGLDSHIFDPAEVVDVLMEKGLLPKEAVARSGRIEWDEDTKLVERALRSFMRSTQLNESAMRQKLGVKYARFADEILPKLLGEGVFEEVPYHGAGVQRRYRLGRTMSDVQHALSSGDGTLHGFLMALRSAPKREWATGSSVSR